MQNYIWRVNMGNVVTVAEGLDTVTLPSGYYLEEARLRDGSTHVYLMKNKKEVKSWEVTETSPAGEEILEYCKLHC